MCLPTLNLLRILQKTKGTVQVKVIKNLGLLPVNQIVLTMCRVICMFSSNVEASSFQFC